ncbi:MAG: peptidase prepilin type [Alphaproteobacteria bacterium]|nr:peptidase prepilin type [Alphaproteobacteria bacterium]
MTFDPAVAMLCVATAVLLYLTVMDVRFFLLPNRGNIALALLGLAYQAISLDWADGNAILERLVFMGAGALCGAGIFLLTRYVSLKWKGVEGIGWGDVKFSAAAGIWLGPAGVGFMIGGAAGLLLLFGVIVIVLTRRPLKDFYLPFGAAAAPATAILLWLNWAGMIRF